MRRASERRKQLEAGVAERLHSAAIHLLRSARRDDPLAGLSPSRASALSVVVFGGPISLGDLATAEQVRAPTMTRLVSSLEADGLVEREADPGDRRIIRVRATPKGRAVLEESRRRRLEHISKQLAELSAAELETLGAAADLLLAGFRPPR